MKQWRFRLAWVFAWISVAVLWGANVYRVIEGCDCNRAGVLRVVAAVFAPVIVGAVLTTATYVISGRPFQWLTALRDLLWRITRDRRD